MAAPNRSLLRLAVPVCSGVRRVFTSVNRLNLNALVARDCVSVRLTLHVKFGRMGKIQLRLIHQIAERSAVHSEQGA